VKRDVSGRGRQAAQQLKAGGEFVAELHPGVLAAEAAYGRDCYGERQLNAWERMGKGLEVVAGGVLRRLGRLADEGVRTVSRLASRVYEGISATASQLKRAWQIRQALKKVSWSKVPKPNVQDPKLQNIKDGIMYASCRGGLRRIRTHLSPIDKLLKTCYTT
jgi:hypothetical protein